MAKKKKSKKRKPRKPQKKSTPITIYIFAIALGMIGYLVGEILFGGQAHPSHWLAALAGVILGYLGGWGVVRWRGDIFSF